MKNRVLLLPEQMEEIAAMMKSTKVSREYRRLQAIYLYGTNQPLEEVMRLTHLGNSTISGLYCRYQLVGLNCIPDAKRSGRPKRLTSRQEAQLRYTILNKTPVDVGFAADFNWTAGLAAAYIKKEYGYEYSIKGVTLIFKRLSLTFTRPTYMLAKADPAKQEQFRQEFKMVKKGWKMIKPNMYFSVANP
jgi:transposase